jgi:hypothetical protein
MVLRELSRFVRNSERRARSLVSRPRLAKREAVTFVVCPLEEVQLGGALVFPTSSAALSPVQL